MDALPDAEEDEVGIRERMKAFRHKAERVSSSYVVCPPLGL